MGAVPARARSLRQGLAARAVRVLGGHGRGEEALGGGAAGDDDGGEADPRLGHDPLDRGEGAAHGALSRERRLLHDGDRQGGVHAAQHGLRDEPRQPAHAHHEHGRGAGVAERREVRRAQVAVGVDHVHGHRGTAMGDGHVTRAGAGDRGGHPGDDLHVHARGAAGEHLLATAAQHEGVTALEPHHALAGKGVLDEHRLDLVLAHGGPAGGLAPADHLDTAGEQVDHVRRAQPVHDHDVGLAQQRHRADGEQVQRPGPAAHEGHRPGGEDGLRETLDGQRLRGG